MSSTWNKALSILDDTIFPGITSPKKFKSGEDEIVSNLFLQVLLYLNIYFFPLWLSSTIVMLITKFYCLTTLYRFIAITVDGSVILIEVLRLYLGYFGNLTEKIPEMAAFWMLSILLQFPLQLFLLVNKHLKQLPLDLIVQSIMFVMLILQLIIGFKALRKSAKHQASKFSKKLPALSTGRT